MAGGPEEIAWSPPPTDPIMTPAAPPLMTPAGPPQPPPLLTLPKPPAAPPVPAYGGGFDMTAPPPPAPLALPPGGAANVAMGGRPNGGIDPRRVVTGAPAVGVPGADAPAPLLGTSLLGDSLSGYTTAREAEAAFIRGQIAGEMRKRGGMIAAVPEKEQRTGFHTEKSAGPDMDLVDEQEDVRLGRELRIPETPPPAPIEGRDILSIFQPPADEKDPKAWAEREAARIREEGGSIVGEVARGRDGTGPLALRALTPDPLPAKLRGKTGEEIDAWERESLARKERDRDGYINALDAAHNAEREKHAKALAGDMREQEWYVRKYGEGGIVGGERRRLGIEASVNEERARMAEEAARIERESADKIRAMDAEAKKRMEPVTREMESVYEAARKGVDQGKFWREKTTGEKFAMALGVAMSAIGSGLTGQANGALKAIDDAMERDLAEQRRQIHEGSTQRLTVLQNTYRNILEETKDAKIAELGMKASALEDYKRRLEAYAERATSAATREAARSLLAKKMDEQLAFEIEMSERMRGKVGTQWRVDPARKAGWGGGPDPRKVRGYLSDLTKLEAAGVDVASKGVETSAKSIDAQAKAANPGGKPPELLRFGNQWYALDAVTSTAEGEKARAAMRGLADVDYFTQRIKEESDKYGTRAFHPEVFTNLLAEHAKALSRAQNEGVTRKEDVDRAKELFGGWTGGPSNVADEFFRYNNFSRDQLLRSYGAREVEGPRRR